MVIMNHAALPVLWETGICVKHQLYQEAILHSKFSVLSLYCL